MTWTTDKPTVPGYYWYKCAAHEAIVVQVCGFSASLVVCLFMLDEWIQLDSYQRRTGSQWAGPLEPPAEVA